MALVLNLIIGVFTVIITFVLYVKKRYSYWKQKNVPFLKPTFPLGNHRTLLPKGIGIGYISMEFYHHFKKMGCKFGGVYMGLSPQILLVDPKYAKRILTTDFAYFVDRGIYENKNVPITVNIFSQRKDEWRKARNKFTNIFTTMKIKTMFDIVEKCSQEMRCYLEGYSDGTKDVDILEVMACYTTDVICCTALGIESNSFTNTNAEFRKIGKKVFGEFHLYDHIKLFLTLYFPELAIILGVSNIQNEATDFLNKSINDVVKYRERNNITRSDFLQLLIDMKSSPNKISMDELVSQAALFFFAAFETSSRTLCMSLLELAQNPEAQEKARNEIGEVLKKFNKVTFEAITEMKYLNQVIEETMRIYPPVQTLTRVCVKNYQLPDTDLMIEEGTMVLIPALALHRDPDYWPDPLKWKPERITEDVKKNSPFFPFGDGPRICLGLKFAYMQVKMGLVAVLSNYEVLSSPNTRLPIELDPDTFVLHTLQTIYIRLKKI